MDQSVADSLKVLLDAAQSSMYNHGFAFGFATGLAWGLVLALGLSVIQAHSCGETWSRSLLGKWDTWKRPARFWAGVGCIALAMFMAIMISVVNDLLEPTGYKLPIILNLALFVLIGLVLIIAACYMYVAVRETPKTGSEAEKNT